jgi:hypothetical protein
MSTHSRLLYWTNTMLQTKVLDIERYRRQEQNLSRSFTLAIVASNKRSNNEIVDDDDETVCKDGFSASVVRRKRPSCFSCSVFFLCVMWSTHRPGRAASLSREDGLLNRGGQVGRV